jgi:hypothetical protein
LLIIAKVVPKTWADMPKPLDWAAGAVPASMSASDAANDLALMDVRSNLYCESVTDVIAPASTA